VYSDDVSIRWNALADIVDKPVTTHGQNHRTLDNLLGHAI
jgi:hypothetical protein